MHSPDFRLPIPASRATNSRPRGFVRRLIALLVAISIAPQLPAAEPPPLAFPLAEPPLAAQLGGIDREWNFSFKIAGKVRVIAAADLAYWGRYHDTDAGP